MTGKNIYLLMYAAIALGCVSISVYLSYYGYYNHLEELSLLFSLILGLLLFVCDMIFRQFRIAQRPLILPLSLFVLVALFSGASNFNFLYTNFMEEDIAERELVGLFDTYRTDLTQTSERLANNPTVSRGLEDRNALDRELAQLKQQITDPRRPGCGTRCRDHMEEIAEILGQQPTDLSIPGVEEPMENQLKWYENYKETVVTDFEEGAAPPEYRRAQQINQRIQQLLAEYKNPHEYLRNKSSLAGSVFLGPNALDLPQQLRSSSFEIEREANTILREDNNVTHDDLDTELDVVGEIPTSFKDGFINRPNIGVTAVSILLGTFIDIIPIFLAFILFGPDARHAQGDEARQKRSQRVVTH